MQVSRYTYMHECEDNSLIIYNSLSGAILKCDDEDKCKEIREILQNSGFLSYASEHLFETLYNYGILIEDDIDEKLIANYRYLQDVMDSRLDLTIMPTEECNFRCSYCYESFKKGKISQENIENFRKFIFNNLRKYTGLSVSWFGGEPLEAVQEMEAISQILLSACKKRKIPYDAGVVTNGYNLTPNVLEKLIKMKVRQIQITIDGTRENHNKYKRLKDGSPTYDVVLNNMRYIRDYCKCATLSVIIRTNVSHDLVQDNR